MKKLIAFVLFLVFSNMSSANSKESSIFSRCRYLLYGTTTSGNNGLSDLVALDPTSGEGHTIGTISGNGINRVTAIDFDNNGYLWGIGEDGADVSSLVRIHCRTGWAYFIGPTGIAANASITDIDFDDNGVLWAYVNNSGQGSDTVGTIDLATGAFTAVGDTGVNNSGNGLAFDNNGTLYHAGNVNINSIDLSTGIASAVSPLTFYPPADTNPRINGMTVRPVNGLIYASVNDKANGSGATPENYLAVLDADNGVVSFLAFPPDLAPDGLTGLAFNKKFRGCLP